MSSARSETESWLATGCGDGIVRVFSIVPGTQKAQLLHALKVSQLLGMLRRAAMNKGLLRS